MRLELSENQCQVLDVCRERVADLGLHGVGTAAFALFDDRGARSHGSDRCAAIVGPAASPDDVEIIASAALQRYDSLCNVETIIAGPAEQADIDVAGDRRAGGREVVVESGTDDPFDRK